MLEQGCLGSKFSSTSYYVTLGVLLHCLCASVSPGSLCCLIAGEHYSQLNSRFLIWKNGDDLQDLTLTVVVQIHRVTAVKYLELSVWQILQTLVIIVTVTSIAIQLAFLTQTS